MNSSSPFLNLYLTRGSKHDLKSNQKMSSISDRGHFSKSKGETQLAIDDVSDHDISRVHLALDTDIRPIVLGFPCRVETRG